MATIESKNLLVWVKAMSRGQALPLDASEIYDSYDAATAYAGTAETKVQELANGAVKTNTDAIAVLNGDAETEGSVDKKVATAKADVEAKVETNTGDITTMKGQIAALEAGTYDDTEVRGLITDNTEAIETLNGDSSVDGSVDKKVADAINAFATQISDDGTINTYKEILNYISTHGGEAAEMASAIDTLETLVGSKSVATQISEAIAAENLSQYATDTELAEAIARIIVVEGKAHEHTNKDLLDTYTQTEANLADAVLKKHAHTNDSVLNGITSDKVSSWDNAESNAKTYADGLVAQFTPITTDEINALFA